MSEASSDPLVDFPMVISLPVQWGDQDSFGHVNNVVYFRWFESARIAYFEKVGLSSLMITEKVGPILAAINCNYRRQLTYPDTVRVGARITKIGRSSMTMEHRLVSENAGTLAAEGDSTIVSFDYDAGKSHPVPEAIREAISRFEGKTL
jgi:acyl-CoA thioester hydrolase